jgi:hypothetical protein
VSRHHAHPSNHLVMALGSAAVIVLGALCWAGWVRLLGGAV